MAQRIAKRGLITYPNLGGDLPLVWEFPQKIKSGVADTRCAIALTDLPQQNC